MVIIRANGQNELVGDEVSLATLQRIVGGYIEVVAIPEGALVVNEDGYALKLPRNHAASFLANVLGRPKMLVGDVVLLTREELALLDWHRPRPTGSRPASGLATPGAHRPTGRI